MNIDFYNFNFKKLLFKIAFWILKFIYFNLKRNDYYGIYYYIAFLNNKLIKLILYELRFQIVYFQLMFHFIIASL